MEQKTVLPPAPQGEAPVTQQLPYAPPKATLVPARFEERLRPMIEDPKGDCADCFALFENVAWVRRSPT
jgi:hypothetical protein